MLLSFRSARLQPRTPRTQRRPLALASGAYLSLSSLSFLLPLPNIFSAQPSAPPSACATLSAVPWRPECASGSSSGTEPERGLPPDELELELGGGGGGEEEEGGV